MTWLTSKIQSGDIPILQKLAQASRLRDKVDWVYRKKRGSQSVIVRELPPGSRDEDWQLRPLFYMGLKLGSRAALTDSGYRVFKGLNVFPAGLRGEPMGLWNKSSPPLDLKIYRYIDFLDPERLFASREIAQLPTIAPVPSNTVFNNTVILIQMREKFPLNGWVLARPVMFAAATCLRATIIEDLGCHWYPKNLGRLPIPNSWSAGDLTILRSATDRLLEADENLANRWRHVETALESTPCQTLSNLIATAAEVVEGFVLPAGGADEFVPYGIDMDDAGLRSGTFFLPVPDVRLRAVLWYLIDQLLSDGEELTLAGVGSLKVPLDPTELAETITTVRNSNAGEAFEAARQELDTVAASLLRLTDEELGYVQERFLSDPFLSQIQPMWAHRGLHVQGYHDHSGGDRFLA